MDPCMNYSLYVVNYHTDTWTFNSNEYEKHMTFYKDFVNSAVILRPSEYVTAIKNNENCE